MDSFLKRKATPAFGASAAKRGNLREVVPGGDPLCVCAWNVNSIGARAKNEANATEVVAFLDSCGADALFFSEVKLAARGVKGAKRDDGTPRSRGTPGEETKQHAESNRAIAALWMRSTEYYAPVYSLADWGYAGTAVLVRRGGAVPRRISFELVAVANLLPPGARSPEDLTPMATGERHHAEGRVILCEYATLIVLHTYSPNNGSDAKGFARRREWEETLRTWVRAVREAGRALVYCGDLNVAPCDADLSHASWFKQMFPNDEALDAGQPGCTERERRCFASLIQAGDLVDAFRAHHQPADDLDGPHFSWRGGKGRYSGRGMRIDHALVSRASAARVVGCELLGTASGGFMGSDHCPIRLRLAPRDDDARDGDDASEGRDGQGQGPEPAEFEQDPAHDA